MFTTFPDPVPGINIFFTPGKLFYTNFAINDANQNAKFLNFYGDPVSVQPTKNGVLLLSESGLTWNHFIGKGKDGNFKLGLWNHTGTFPKIDGTTQQATQGLYLIFNQTLWQPDFNNNPARGIRMFLEYSQANASVAPVYKHYGGGLVWTGISPERKDDAIGITAHCVRLSPDLHLNKQHETNIETFYKVIITNWLNVKADAQYIINPGGIYNNALVGMVILNFSFSS
jgi:porin